MKVISVWQPFASLLVKGHKIFETRGWAAPSSLLGKTIGIASTKTIVPGQRKHFADPAFREFYDRLQLPELNDLHMGYLLGTVMLDSVELMTEEFMEGISDEEKSYGWWSVGNYAWRVVNPFELPHPIPIRGAQGIFDWKGLDDGLLGSQAGREGASG
jgi:hypothetical protein